jgi:hypothetical protein
VSAVLETAVIALGVNGLASTSALVYVVRRVAPQPKLPALPALPGSGSNRRRNLADAPADGQDPAANGSDPARSTAAPGA